MRNRKAGFLPMRGKKNWENSLEDNNNQFDADVFNGKDLNDAYYEAKRASFMPMRGKKAFHAMRGKKTIYDSPFDGQQQWKTSDNVEKRAKAFFGTRGK